MREKGKSGSDALDRALADWRSSPDRPQRLAGHVRARILDDARRAPERRLAFRPVAPLFAPARRYALAAALPALLLTVALGYLLIPGNGEVAAIDGPIPRLQATRDGDDVVFVIANGGTAHRVVKSSDPNGLDAAEPLVVTEGVFRDRVDSGSDLVFYRID